MVIIGLHAPKPTISSDFAGQEQSRLINGAWERLLYRWFRRVQEVRSYRLEVSRSSIVLCFIRVQGHLRCLAALGIIFSSWPKVELKSFPYRSRSLIRYDAPGAGFVLRSRWSFLTPQEKWVDARQSQLKFSLITSIFVRNQAAIACSFLIRFSWIKLREWFDKFRKSMDWIRDLSAARAWRGCISKSKEIPHLKPHWEWTGLESFKS